MTPPVSAVVRSAWRSYQPRGIARRAAYELAVRVRWPQRAERRARPPLAFPAAGSARAGRTVEAVRDWFTAQPNAPVQTDQLVASASALLTGAVPLYGGQPFDVGWPPRWDRHPTTGEPLPHGHWTRLHDDGDGDIKDPWELARLAWASAFLRAFAVTGDERWAEAWWTAVEGFASAHPPFDGIHWLNGQEVALRGISLMLGADALFRADASTPARTEIVGSVLAASATRVGATLGHALSQRNNHAICEAAFLWSLAVRYPDLTDRREVQQHAARALSESVRDQFDADGGYAQHSFTYQRLAMHALLWVLHASRTVNEVPPAGVVDAIASGLHWLSPIADDRTGWLPNLGSNDGARLFPLSEGHIRDFRPMLVHAAGAIGQPSPFEPGAWDEEARWFGLDPDANRSARPSPTSSGHTSTDGRLLRGGQARLFVRAGPLRHRLGQADQLHVDVWLGGHNVVRDAGTFRYSGAPPWRNALAGDEVHNGPRIAGHRQARLLGRFFWLDWPEPRELCRVAENGTEVAIYELALRGEAGTGKPAASVRRLVARIGDLCLVADLGTSGAVAVRWNLPPDARVDETPSGPRIAGTGFHAAVSGAADVRRLVPTDDDPASGWESITYGERSPLVALEVTSEPGRPLVTQFGAPDVALLAGIDLEPWRRAVELATEQAVRDVRGGSQQGEK